MAIAFTKYVDIISGVGGAAQVAERELIGRLFSTNQLIPTKSFAEFTDLESVLAYFGSASEEYKRASFYFGFVSKQTTAAKKLSFARWAVSDTFPQIFGERADYLVGDFTGITDGTFNMTLGTNTFAVTGLDFSTATSLADVATIISTEIKSLSADPVWAASTTSYNATDKSFDFVGGDAGVYAINVESATTGTDVAPLIGWENAETIFSDGVLEESITDVLTESAGASNNFGSFSFIPAIVADEIVEAGQWTKAQNVRFMFCHSVLEVDAQSTYDAVLDLAGVAITIKDNTPDEYPDMMPMIILAATDYDRRNANQNYMYQQFAISATVTDTLKSNNLDAIRMNYYGETQQAGRLLRFYQRGLLMGLATDPKDMNTFANEQWFKDAAAVAVMNLLLALSAVPANNTGRAQILGVLQGVIDRALFNATISVGKPINDTQKAYITQVTGDPEAWRQINDIGYWINATVKEDTQNPGEWVGTYLLLYAKADAIRKVEGTHTLI